MTATTRTVLPLLLFCLASLTVTAQDTAGTSTKPTSKISDHQLVEASVRDYVEGIYDVQPERIIRSVSPKLSKYGFWRHEAKSPYKGSPMSFDELKKLAANYNEGGKRIPKGAPKKIEVLGILPLIATVKLTAAWGIDYMQLEKTKTGWKIRHVLWQSQVKDTAPASKEDRASVTKAVSKYAQAFYTQNAKLIDKAVHPRLAKFGFYNGHPMPMNFEQLKSLAKTAYKDQKPATMTEDIEVLDCLDKIACVKLIGAWGTDFILLQKEQEGWMIRDVIWQTPPPVTKKTSVNKKATK